MSDDHGDRKAVTMAVVIWNNVASFPRPLPLFWTPHTTHRLRLATIQQQGHSFTNYTGLNMTDDLGPVICVVLK